MELVWKQLLNTMEAMTKHCVLIIDLAQKQRTAVTKEEIQKIGEIVIEQERAMVEFQNWEQERQALIRDISRQLEIPESELTSARLLQVVPAAWTNAYRAQIQGLQQSMLRVKQEHEAIRKLISHSQQFVSWLIQYLVTPEGAAPMYDAQGGRTQKSYYHVVNQAL
jgi:hypothetical protein